jgi:DNA invertase Pin-like site-specific DNA recombinase
MEEMRKIGGMRVSKQEQREAFQIDALKEAGCEKWSTVISYFPSSNAMPNMSASSAVAAIR